MPKKESEEKIKLPVHIQEQFGMKTWYGHQKLTENLFIWKFRFGGFELPGWDMIRDEPVREKGGPSMASSLWQLEKKHAGPVVHVETFECASREAAHDYVLALLADFQSPDVHYLPKGDYGDAMFSGKTGDRMAVFVRGNLVIRLRNAERELTSVFPLAQHLDQLLTEKPEQPKNLKEGPMIVRFEEMPVAKRSAKTNARNEIALTIQAEDPDDYPVWYKFFAPDGEVVEAGKVLTYRPSKSGSHKITAIAVNSAGRTSRSSLVLKTG